MNREEILKCIDDNQMALWSIEDVFEEGYTIGYQDCKQEMIEKACEWLRENLRIEQTAFQISINPIKFINAEEAFIKAMEE